MNLHPRVVQALALLLLTAAAPVQTHEAIAGPLARFPTVSAGAIAFVAQGALWTMPRTGGRARRLTDDPGQMLAPRFSPDGTWIAFTWRRHGANDVYVVPAKGGAPTRLTHGPSTNPYDNLVSGWTPDGAKVLFVSARAAWGKRFDTYAVARTGGLAVSLGLGHAGLSSLSPDGTKIAFDWSYRNLGGDRWKRYRGGQAGELWIFDQSRRITERLTHWNGIDTSPMWAGDRIYFLSDRGPEQRLNIWVIDPASKSTRQITRYADYDIDMPSLGAGAIAFQQGGRLRLLDLASERVRDVAVGVPNPRERPRTLSAASYLQHEDIVDQPDYALGDDGTTFLSARGDLFSLSPDGRWSNLTRTPGHVEDHPVVSPDGTRLAYVTDAGGEQQVAMMQIGASSRPRVLTGFRSGVLYTPRWSPDGRWLTVADANKRLWLVAADGTGTRLIASDPYAEIQDAAFSLDGRRLAYSVTRPNQTRAIHLRDVTGATDIVLSGPLDTDHDPAFSGDGRSLFFVSQRREHPFVSDRDREGTIATLGSDGLYRATLPLAPGDGPGIFDASTREMPTGGAGGFARLRVRGGILYYQSTPLQAITGALPGQHGALRAMGDGVPDRLVADDVGGFALSPDGRRALVHRSADGDALAVVDLGADRASPRTLVLDRLKVTVDPAAERREMFEQAWRLDRDLFWDPRMNGVDWRAVHDRYAPLVAQARSHEDMIYLLGEMQGELSTSHMFLGGGDAADPGLATTTALLGVDFALDDGSGRYRLARIYRGDNSRERFRAPLGDPALGVNDGDFLLAVDGRELRAPEDPYAQLADRAGPVRLTLASRADAPRRTVTVDPIASEKEVRKLDWIDRNRAAVDRLGGGRIGYVFVSDFLELGAEDFLRQYYAQTGRAGLVIDDRDDAGGFTSQWVLDLLRRPQAGIFRNREGGITTLPGAIAPPKLVTVTNIFSASDGDQFPYFFKKWRMGPVVGQRTWGGVRGIKGPWRLIDGTWMTVPKDSLLTIGGQPIIENRGAEPDVTVDDTPTDAQDGVDRQLERATNMALGR